MADSGVSQQRIDRGKDRVELRQHLFYLRHHVGGLAHHASLLGSHDGVTHCQSRGGHIPQSQFKSHVAQQVAGNLGTGTLWQLHVGIKS